jgi:hypothetical protein
VLSFAQHGRTSDVPYCETVGVGRDEAEPPALGRDEQSQETLMAFVVVRELMLGASDTELQSLLGNVNSCIDDRMIVLAHTC